MILPETPQAIDGYRNGAGDAQRLLIVEDDRIAGTLLARALSKHHYVVELAASIEQALEISARWAPQAAIVDLRLGSESGLRLIPALAQRNPAIRILVLTGYASVATAVQAMKLGASDYLAKPADIPAIISVLRGREVQKGLEPGMERPSVRRLEWEYIQRVLAEHNGNISETARALGMLRRTLQRKLAKRPARH